MKLHAAAALVVAATLGGIALASACTGSQRPPPPRTPGTTPLLALSASGAPARLAGIPKDPWSIEEFTPLLALPALEGAARAVEAESWAQAARELEQTLAKAAPAASDVPRWQLLLGRLRERAGDLGGAAASYDLAATAEWELAGWARIGQARVELRRGRPKNALDVLAKVPPDEPLASEARPLVAEAANLVGDRPRAIEAWRAILAAPKRTTDRVAVSLGLAEALLAEPAAAVAATAAVAKAPAAAAPVPAGPTAAPVSAAPVASGSASAAPPDPDARFVEALGLARKVRLEQLDDGAVARRAATLEARALAGLSPVKRKTLERPSREEELLHVRALLATGRERDAEEAAEAMIATRPEQTRWDAVGCEAAILRAKAMAAAKENGKAADSLNDPIRACTADTELRARMLWLGGKLAEADGRNAQAIQRWELLEKDAPKSRLADDARMRAAFAWQELGVESRFTELLGAMPEDYPEGDMVLDGVFRLAMRRIEKDDWSGAANLLDRGAEVAKKHEAERGQEFSGRERYFRARAWIATGEKARGLDELEAIVRELPLSYYMLHAFSRLEAEDAPRALRARDEARARAASDPFVLERRPEFDTPPFRRAMELLRIGDVDAARLELDAAGDLRRDAAPGVLWGIALLYARAGNAKLSHEIARGLLADWLGRWPSGDWVRAWQIGFPRPYKDIVEREAKKHALRESMVFAVMREESGFDPHAHSPADAYGLMQLIVPTAKLHAKGTGLPYDARSLQVPAINVALGCRTLEKLFEQFDGDPVLVLSGYNAGPGRPRRWMKERPSADLDVWIESIPLSETRRYVKRVLASRAAYAALYDPDHADEAMRLPLRIGG